MRPCSLLLALAALLVGCHTPPDPERTTSDGWPTRRVNEYIADTQLTLVRYGLRMERCAFTFGVDRLSFADGSLELSVRAPTPEAFLAAEVRRDAFLDLLPELARSGVRPDALLWETGAKGEQCLSFINGKLSLTEAEGPCQEPADARATVRSQPLAPPEPARETRFGDFRWMGGVVLPRADARGGQLGGYSALHVGPACAGGREVALFSDFGHCVLGRIELDANGLGSFAGSVVRGLPDQIEAVAWLDGALLVSLEEEGRHRLVAWRVGADGLAAALAAPPVPTPHQPAEMSALGREGVEALTELADGRVLALAHSGATEAEPSKLWLSTSPDAWEDDLPAWEAPRTTYPRTLVEGTADSYQPKGAALLPSGDVVVIEHRYLGSSRPQRARLRVLDRATVAAGEPGEGRVSSLDGLALDNFEAVGAFSAGDKTYVLIAADDNGNRKEGQTSYLYLLRYDPVSAD